VQARLLCGDDLQLVLQLGLMELNCRDLVFDGRTRNARLDGVDQAGKVPVNVTEFFVEAGALLVFGCARSVQFAIELGYEFYLGGGLHHSVFKARQHCLFHYIPTDGQHVVAGALVAGRRAAVMLLADL